MNPKQAIKELVKLSEELGLYEWEKWMGHPNVVGRTEDGKIVVKNVYYLYETHGVPLEVIFSYLKDKNLIVDWLIFYEDAKNAGVKNPVSKIEEPLKEVYGNEFAEEVLERLNFYTKDKETTTF